MNIKTSNLVFILEPLENNPDFFINPNKKLVNTADFTYKG